MEIHLVERKGNKYENVEILSETQFFNLVRRFIHKHQPKGISFLGYKLVKEEDLHICNKVITDLQTAFQTRLRQNLNRRKK